MTVHILIVNKVPGAVHIVVPSLLMPSMHIFNVLYFVSRMCTLGTGWVHTNCVCTVPGNLMRGYRLVASEI